ncbi:GNAT family N-acetyltransferase [Alkaliphilus hydrothermalis]|nr:GNAT family N-acetyltransferase [Alkaliphilus hydrothermalis]
MTLFDLVWDAVDIRSIALAEKLGYSFDKEYEVYMI